MNCDNERDINSAKTIVNVNLISNNNVNEMFRRKALICREREKKTEKISQQPNEINETKWIMTKIELCSAKLSNLLVIVILKSKYNSAYTVTTSWLEMLCNN